MTLKQYLLDSEIDKIEDDEEFCKAEYELIQDYINLYMLTEDDLEEIKNRGYDSSYFLN